MSNQAENIPPDHPWLVPLSHLRHSLNAASAGHQREAVAAALAAYQARLPAPELLRELARCLQHLGEVRAMYTCAHDISILRGGNPPVVFQMAGLLARSGFHGDAHRLIQLARGEGLRGLQLAWLSGQCLHALGLEETAARDYRLGLDMPGRGPLLLGLSQMAPTTVVDDAELETRLAEAVAASSDGDPQLPMLLYAQFAVLDRQGQTGPAWQALERAMPLRRAQVPYDPDAAQALHEYLGNRRIAAAEDESARGPRPVFVVGLPGTGITRLARSLAVHPGIADPGALDALVMAMRWAGDKAGGPLLDLDLARSVENIDFADLGRAYLSQTQWRAGNKPVFLDRNPDNYACIPWIMQALPGARVLHLVGGPMDTCFANLGRWREPRHGWSHDQVETADHYRRYRALMAHMRALYPDRILDVRQDELASDPGAALREAIGFCGLSWHEAMDTDAAKQPEAPVLQWRRYEAGLAPLRQRLGALAY